MTAQCALRVAVVLRSQRDEAWRSALSQKGSPKQDAAWGC